MTTILSILILAIAVIYIGRRLRRKRSRAAAEKALPRLPILTDEEMERILEENDRAYEQLMADERALQAMFASHDSQQAKQANPKAANPAPPKRRNRTTISCEPRKVRTPRTQVATNAPTQQQVQQQNLFQTNSLQVNSSQRNATQSAPQSTTLPRIQSRPPAATWLSRWLAPIQIAARRLYMCAILVVLAPLRMGAWILRTRPPANFPEEPQRRAA